MFGVAGLLAGAVAVLWPGRAPAPETEAMVILEEDEPQSSYPFLARSMSEQRLGELLFDRLFVRSESGYLVSQIFAKEITARNTRLQLEVREGLKFADGTPVTFADVAYSFNEVYRRSDVGHDAYSWYGMVFGEARQITDRIGDVVFLVSMPDEEPEQYLRTTVLFSRKSLDPERTGTPDLYGSRRQPVGTGPYYAAETIESFDDVQLLRNPHREGSAQEGAIQSLQLLYDQDSARQKELMLGRKADLWVAAPPAVVPEFRGQSETFKVTPYELNQWWYVAVDTRDPVLSDPQVRQALDLLIPRGQLMEKFGETSATAMSGPFMAGSAWSAPDVAPTSEDAKLAAQLLQKAGLVRDGSLWKKDGEPLSFVLGVQADILDDYNDVVYGLADGWENAGIRVKVRGIRQSDWRETVETGGAPQQFDLILGRWNVDREEGVLDLFVARPEGAARTVNIMGYVNPKIDTAVQAFYQESSGPEREALMRDLHYRLHEDRPYLFLWSLKVQSVVRRDRLKGVHPSKYYYYTSIDDWRWREP